ncbi:C10 family peptidase [Seonamhaeicola sp. NFXS20]|uniref:C10 family peptidase n=1 Tax=Seonamhaeicola sp. NFXS20 TaxID=2816959 RepID=UPI003B8CA686
MSKILILASLVLSSLLSVHSQVNKNAFLDYAKAFMVKQQLDNKRLLEPSDVNELKFDDGTICAYVVNLKPKGFIVFSSSKKMYPVLSFSTESNFDYSASQENYLLNMVKADMGREMKRIKDAAVTKDHRAWEQLVTIGVNKSSSLSIKTETTAASASLIQYGAHLSSVWGGVNCYDDQGNGINVGNYYTPNNYSPGCVATSLSMVMHYYKWPETGVGAHTNYDTSGSSQTSWTANFGNANYDWDNMLDEYYGVPSTLTQQKAMGYISFHAATALDMDYEPDGSTSNINRIPSAAGSYFRFSGHHQYSSWSSFWSRMHENLENGHPVPVAIETSSGAGHAPVVDGYRYYEGDPESEYYYHLNMGWYGTSNAWYRLQGSFSAGGYTSVTAAVFDLLPEPAFTETSIDATDKTFTLNWKTSHKINWDAFELQESTDGGTTYSTVSSTITDTTYTVSVLEGGTYKYRVRSKVDGFFYANSYSEPIEVTVPYDYVYLDFDGNDSFFVYDNSNNDFDISDTYTIETWINIDSRTTGTYPVILDRQTVFSLFLIADANADYAVKFAARDSSGNIIASVQSDSSSENLSFGDWVHVAVSRNNGVTKLFVNGTQVDSSTDSDFELTASTKALNVGARYWGGYERYLDGKIDKIRISNSAVYTSGFVPDLKEKYTADNNTIILLALDEGAGTDLTDGAGNFSVVQLRSSPNQPNWMFGDEDLSEKSNNAKVLNTNENIVDENRIHFYPNPAFIDITGKVKIDISQKYNILIYNSLGQLVMSKEVNLEKGENELNVNVINLESGLYFLELNSLGKKYKTKFIKN